MNVTNTNLYEKVEDINGNISFVPFDYNNITICGKGLSEIIDILNCLDLERQYDMKMTMENLQKWGKLLQEEFENSLYHIKYRATMEDEE